MVPRLAAALAVLLSTLAVPASTGAQTVWPPYGPIPPGTQITITVSPTGWTVEGPSGGSGSCSAFGLPADLLFFGGISWTAPVDFGPEDALPRDLFNPGPITLPPVQLSQAFNSTELVIEAPVAMQGEVTPGNYCTERGGEIHYGPWQVIRGAAPPPHPPPGSPGSGGPAKCPEAAGLLASARYWNEVAQRHRGLSVQAHQAVIDYWGKASAAFYAVLGIAAADLPGDLISKGTAKQLARKETLDGYRQLWQNSLNGKWPEISRQLRVLTELQKFLKALGPIGKLDATLHAGESLYWLGLAAQQGVIRDRMDAIADAALKNATDDQRRAARACDKGAAGAAAAASAGRTPPYTKLARPRAVKRLRLELGGRKARALNKLLAGQERATALADVVGDSAARALAAEKAGKKTWRDRQLRHARRTARKLASHLDAQARRRGQIAASLDSAPRSVEITEPAKLGKLLRKIGLPDVVKRLGFKPQALRRIFTKPPAGQLTLASLADPAGAERYRTWAAALRALAAGP